MRLRDKVAIVTGGSSGIGEAVAVAFAREGASVVIDYHGNAEHARSVVESIEAHGGRAVAVGADVSKEEDVKKLVEAAVADFGSLDILVNNAGIERQMPFLETPLDVWRSVIETNLTGAWICSQLAAREMAKGKRGGRIINISSVHEDVTMPSNAPYCASKGGMKMLMRTIAVELAPLDITVNNVCPGAIDTPIQKNLEKDPHKVEELLSEIPLRRMGSPEEVAGLCVFLASEAGSYVTGASYIIDGGMTKQSGSL
ncbi:MAG TPA: SDR family oxidoreductase [Candidatus Baltobacteraceae bacterium]